MTVDELANRWLESDPAKRTSTRTRDDLAIRLHIIPALGSKKLAQVTAPDIQCLVNDWATKRAPRTVRREYAVLRAMFAYAVGSDWLARSPCRRIKQPALRPVVRPQLLPEDVDAIATAVGSRYSTIVWCGALLGLRWGEVAGLRVGDLDLLGSTLRISQQRPAHGPAGPPKSKAGERPLSLPAALVTMLAAHLSACNLTGANESILVFTSPNGTPIDYSNWRRRIWVPAVRKGGVPAASFHDLRRTNANQLVASGVETSRQRSRVSDTRTRGSPSPSTPKRSARRTGTRQRDWTNDSSAK